MRKCKQLADVRWRQQMMNFGNMLVALFTADRLKNKFSPSSSILEIFYGFFSRLLRAVIRVNFTIVWLLFLADDISVLFSSHYDELHASFSAFFSRSIHRFSCGAIYFRARRNSTKLQFNTFARFFTARIGRTTKVNNYFFFRGFIWHEDIEAICDKM